MSRTWSSTMLPSSAASASKQKSVISCSDMTQNLCSKMMNSGQVARPGKLVGTRCKMKGNKIESTRFSVLVCTLMASSRSVRLSKPSPSRLRRRNRCTMDLSFDRGSGSNTDLSMCVSGRTSTNCSFAALSVSRCIQHRACSRRTSAESFAIFNVSPLGVSSPLAFLIRIIATYTCRISFATSLTRSSGTEGFLAAYSVYGSHRRCSGLAVVWSTASLTIE
mmetsp:Transcript_24008/g.83306  ORF Transcript_24008/g.83306 Transcript_24008/m.83306 type:complete len:221 (-) Transcript_24008:305-967(-)